MSQWRIQNPAASLHHPTTGALVGFLGADGREYLIATQAAGPSQTATPTLYDPASVAITGGAINGASVGVTTPAVVRTSNLQAAFTDSSGSPGNATNNSPRGKAAFAAAASTVVITSSLVTATSTVLCVLQGADATLTDILRVVPAAGSFTVTGNAAATAATPFSFMVIN